LAGDEPFQVVKGEEAAEDSALWALAVFEYMGWFQENVTYSEMGSSTPNKMFGHGGKRVGIMRGV
jgi:hypothetical protein